METPKTHKQKRKQRKEAEGLWVILDRKKLGVTMPCSLRIFFFSEDQGNKKNRP